jgi:hypothetical protein
VLSPTLSIRGDDVACTSGLLLGWLDLAECQGSADRLGGRWSARVSGASVCRVALGADSSSRLRLRCARRRPGREAREASHASFWVGGRHRGRRAGTGNLIVTSIGHVYACGSAVGYGQHITKKPGISGIASAPGARGYWLFSAKGATYGLGSTRSLAAVHGSTPVIAVTTDGRDCTAGRLGANPAKIGTGASKDGTEAHKPTGFAAPGERGGC